MEYNNNVSRFAGFRLLPLRCQTTRTPRAV